MRSEEATRISNWIDNHPDSVDVVIVATGETCKALFDNAYKDGGRDKAGGQKQTLHRHLTAYIGYVDYFIGSSKRGASVTVDGDSYVIVSAERHRSEGFVSVWLA